MFFESTLWELRLKIDKVNAQLFEYSKPTRAISPPPATWSTRPWLEASARIGRAAVFTPMWWVPTGKNQREPLQVGWYHSVAEDLCRLLTHWVPSWGVQYYVSRSDRLYLFRGNNAQYTLPTTSLWNIGMCVLRNASVKQLNLRRLWNDFEISKHSFKHIIKNNVKRTRLTLN